MWDMVINFIIGLIVIGIPCYVFYRVGIDAGIERGVRRQLLRELTLGGIVEMSESKPRHRQPHSPA